MDVGKLNQLRRSIRKGWEGPGENPKPLIYLLDEDRDHDEPFDALRKIASELGIRYIKLGLAEGLTQEQEVALQRKSPRLVAIHSLELMPAEHRAEIQDRICTQGSRTLVVIVGFDSKDRIDKTTAAWKRLKELDAREARIQSMRQLAIA